MRRPISPVTLILLALAGTPALAADALTPRLQACRAIADVPARAACYDKVVDDQAGPARAAATPATPAPTAQAAVAPAPQARLAPPTVTPRSSVPIPAPTGTLTAKVVTFSPDPTGKATITLDNGQVSTQIELVGLTLRPGDGVTLRPGSFGSYFLVPDGLGSTFRVTQRR
ncbi:MAG: hypothetical protein EXQ84_03280, partial [Rhodospirillaceae bacterium]|nr:hypothetical protein [Rhodospirillaceae bacterium]